MKSDHAQEKRTLIDALSNSLYAGAKKESVVMVLNYCQAAQLDPFIKPVHIVPMSVKNPVTGRYEFRDVVMPGINLYRIQAARSQKYAGISEPEFGPEKSMKLSNGQVIRYPTYCKVTVKRLEGEREYQFSAKEFWLENYATKGKDSQEPNTMWQKRPFAQLAKCAEAQALRKGFPEICPAVTAEEVEGKTWESEAGVSKLPSVASTSDEVMQLLENKSPEPPSVVSLQEQLMQAVIKQKIPTVTVKAWLKKAGVEHTQALSDTEAQKCLDWIAEKSAI